MMAELFNNNYYDELRRPKHSHSRLSYPSLSSVLSAMDTGAPRPRPKQAEPEPGSAGKEDIM